MSAEEHGDDIPRPPPARDGTIQDQAPAENALQEQRAQDQPLNHTALHDDSTADASLGQAEEDPKAPMPVSTDEGLASPKTTTTESGARDGLPMAATEQARRSAGPPLLSIDTRRLAVGSNNSSRRSSSPLSADEHAQPMSAMSAPTRMPPPYSASSTRTRPRGFSLRRSLLERTALGHSEGNSPPESLTPRQLSLPRSLPHASIDRPVTQKGNASIMVSPVAQDENSIELRSGYSKGAPPTPPLRRYETWTRNKAARASSGKRVRLMYQKLRETLLRIHDIPPSKDGRQIDLDCVCHKALIDDRTGHEYIDNTICSSRYSLWNFLPRQLVAQFSKLANFYFLCVSILQMIPGLSTTGNYTTIVPLTFFVIISMAKEGYDDLRRYRLDKIENMKIASVARSSSSKSEGSCAAALSSVDWIENKWKDVRVGDVVKLQRDEAAPADIVLLHVEGLNGVAYFETMALDGETNLKNKQASPPLASGCNSTAGLLACNARLVVEDPNLDLYSFDGKVIIDKETMPLTNSEVVYRGSVLRNTREAIGVVVYSGEECKIRMNATKNPRVKAPALQTVVNRVVVIIVSFVIALAIFNTVAYQIWAKTTEKRAWYLTDARVAFFPILTSFIILFNTMVPLSLYVSLEIVKAFQMLLMNDIEMYDEDSNTPMEARTNTINEELGQVNYIFSDKTGTLTNNTMRFRKMSVAGTAWLHDLDLQEEALYHAARRLDCQPGSSKGKKPIRRKTDDSRQSRTSGFHSSGGTLALDSVARDGTADSAVQKSIRHYTELRTKDLLHYIHSRPHTMFARRVRFFLLSLALCHTCIPETGQAGDINYQSSSPDEQALVRAAQELGYIVIDRQALTITVKIVPSGSGSEPVVETYQILDVIEFSSTRKRMSIVVRFPDNRICVLCKGADSMIMQKLRQRNLAVEQATKVEQRVSKRQSSEAQEAIRRHSEQRARKDSMTRASFSLHRHSLGGMPRPSMTTQRLQPIRDELEDWLRDRETDVDQAPPDHVSELYSPRPSTTLASHQLPLSPTERPSFHSAREQPEELVEESLVVDDSAVFERCFQHVNDFASEGLRTLLYGFRFLGEEEYVSWRKIFLDASTSLVNRQELVERAGDIIEQNFELAGATAIEDKLQKGVPQAIEKLRRANIRLWMLTGDKRETAINIGHSCRLIKDYSAITILDYETGDVNQRMASATLDISRGQVAHSVVVIDGHTLGILEADDAAKQLFVDLAILVDSVICCRASPGQKAWLVGAIRRKVKNAVTLAIGDGANDIAMIQEAHVGIGITGKEGLQAARTSDYSIAQFRFLLRLLLVHGHWNYIRTCKYILGTFWKEMLFYLTQALFQRYAGYTGTSLYESWSLSMFNTLFTSLPVIFVGIFEKDLAPSTLLAVPELYTFGHRNGGFNLIVYAGWVFMASSDAMLVYFLMLGLYGQTDFTIGTDLFSMGALTFTACVIIIATKIQFFELHNKSITCAIAMFLSIGGWFLWNLILSTLYSNNVIYDVKDGLLVRFGRNALWWLTLIIIILSVWIFEIAVCCLKGLWRQSDVEVFQELEKDPVISHRFEKAANGECRSSPGRLSRQPSEWIEETRAGMRDVPRTAEDQRQREGEVEELLKRPRVMFAEGSTDAGSSVRRRQHSEGENNDDKGNNIEMNSRETEDERDKGHAVNRSERHSFDVHELLKRGFGTVRGSLDVT